MAKRKKPKTRPGRIIWRIGGVMLVLAVGYGAFLAWRVTAEFDARKWDLPARVYAAPFELYPGLRLDPMTFETELSRLGYSASSALSVPGTYVRRGRSFKLYRRPFRDAAGAQPALIFDLEFGSTSIESLSDDAGRPLLFAMLDPMQIGSLFPAHGEDRIVVAPEDLPTLLIDGLKAVEDRRFDSHFGLDFRGIARAAFVNIRSGSLEQGASTLTQQLVRSYYLNTDRTWWRKIREAFMAIALEAQTTKDEIALAYVNEVYLGQDGARAIHGFGLAAQFYFGKTLQELELHELALLIGQVRGPSFYEPRRNSERALERRGRVLDQMHEQGLIDATTLATANARPLGVTPRAAGSAYYAGFLDLVRRQLRADYEREDLEVKGLSVYTTLDPHIQALAEQSMIAQLDALQPDRPALDAAVIVTTPQNAEVKALIGGRQPGFNRALDARRQVGSLLKPAVYLAALEKTALNFASSIEDLPIDVELENGDIWSPKNFEGDGNGKVTMARALAESLNMATVRLGLEAGVDNVADTIARLGLESRPTPFPSLLLGAVDLTPIEVATVYNTIANSGFRESLRSVRAVVDSSGTTLQHYRIEIEQVASAQSIYALNRALTQVMNIGTGKTAQRRLPAGLTTAGKTGTSDDLRDSWFAGFSANHLVVTWVGNDANEPIGLTGATGAARIWSGVMGQLDTRAYAPPVPEGVRDVWIDYETGLETEADCPAAVLLAVAQRDVPAKARSCGSDRTTIGSRIRRLFDGSFE